MIFVESFWYNFWTTISHTHIVFLFYFFSLYCFRPITREQHNNNNVVPKVVKKWLFKYHYP